MMMANSSASPIHLGLLQIISIGYFRICLSEFTHISLVGHIFCPRSKIRLGWHLVRKINMCWWKAGRGSNSAFTLFSVSLDLMNLPRALSAICAVGFFTMVVAPTIFWGAGPMVLVFTIIPLVLVSSPPHNHHHQEALTASLAHQSPGTKHETYSRIKLMSLFSRQVMIMWKVKMPGSWWSSQFLILGPGKCPLARQAHVKRDFLTVQPKSSAQLL